MKKWVSVNEKREFIKWFLDNHRLKRPETRKLLDYISKRHHILEHVSFTEEINVTKKTIIISSTQSDEPGFTFYFNKQKTDNMSKALGELMSFPLDKIYLLFNFYGKTSNYRYTQLLDTPFIENVKHYEKFKQYEKEADALIDKVTASNQIALLQIQIDQALDKGDKPLFISLVNKLNDLKKNT